MNGVSEANIMRQTRHKSSGMVWRYVRDASVFRENVSARVGLLALPQRFVRPDKA
jgi:hypothetical protein